MWTRERRRRQKRVSARMKRERERAVETEVERGAVGGGRQPAGETAAAVGRRLGGCAKEGVD